MDFVVEKQSCEEATCQEAQTRIARHGGEETLVLVVA
jgi:hypothetical protein